MSSARLEAICTEIRCGQNVIVRAELTLEAKLIYEELHPETMQGAAPGKAGGGKKAKAATVASFDRFIAEQTHRSARAVRLDVQIATGIAPEIRERLRDTKHASATRTLLYIATHNAEQEELTTKFFGSLDDEIYTRVRGESRKARRAKNKAWRAESRRRAEARELPNLVAAIRSIAKKRPDATKEIIAALDEVRAELVQAEAAE